MDLAINSAIFLIPVTTGMIYIEIKLPYRYQKCVKMAKNIRKCGHYQYQINCRSLQCRVLCRIDSEL